MYNRSLVFVLLLVGFFVIPATYAENSTACGDVLRFGREGQIQYKVEQPYEVRERCVWTIRIPDATSIIFELLESGIGADVRDKITITTFTRDFRPLIASQSLRQVSDGPVTLDGNVAIVVFHTAGSGSGFVLNYEGAGTVSSYNISSFSRDFISKEIFDGVLDYPNGGTYNNEELSTFVIPPPEFIRDYRIIEVSYRRKGLEVGCGNCCDYVEMYTFDVVEATWIYEGLYCSITSGQDYHQDIALYIFQSDETNAYSGFSLNWNFPDGALHTTTSTTTPAPSTNAT